MCDAGCDAGPLSSIVWANFLASGWFVQLAHSCYLSKSAHCYLLSCYFFSYLPTVSFSLLLLSYCYPDWINGTITYFPNTCILTCPLLLSFLLLFFPTCPLFLFFLSLYSYCYPNQLLLSFLFLFSHLSTVTFFPVTFFPTCPLLLSFLLLFFLLLFFLPETVTFFPVTFFPVTFFPCTVVDKAWQLLTDTPHRAPEHLHLVYIMTVWGQWTNTGVSLIDPSFLDWITANLNKRMPFSYNKNEFENVVCKMAVRLSWSQWDLNWHSTGPYPLNYKNVITLRIYEHK